MKIERKIFKGFRFNKELLERIEKTRPELVIETTWITHLIETGLSKIEKKAKGA